MIACLIILAILLILLLWPLRFEAELRYDEDGPHGQARLYPLWGLPRPLCILWGEGRKKTRQKEDKPAKQRKTKAKAPPADKDPQQTALELVDKALALLGDAKRGLKRLRLRATLAFAFGDPAINGEVCAALYSVLPPLVGDPQGLRWRLRIEPQWWYDGLLLALNGRLTVNLLDLLLAFGPMLPRTLRFIKDLRRIDHERTTSHRVSDAKCA